ncbi:hypothetical protein PIB30_117073 [Stylosanthes scabra]|uniref:Uncharacterized protein n=1 Tax=Stylosanthes scabra TaxID=79078 RepID=A0ABU6STT2_9FABA|nr:hypothetical protein [Stylosanthes scabra]
MARSKNVKEPELHARRKRDRPRNKDGQRMKMNPSRCSPKGVADVWQAIALQENGAKLREVEGMGFGVVKHILSWKVNQPLMVALAAAYDRDTKSLLVGTRKILITVELIARCLGFSNHGI